VCRDDALQPTLLQRFQRCRPVRSKPSVARRTRNPACGTTGFNPFGITAGNGTHSFNTLLRVLRSKYARRLGRS
jgi:hypothetical protein